LDKTFSSLSKEYIYTFPEILHLEKYKENHPALSDAELAFYKKYVGSYIRKESMNRSRLLRCIYQIQTSQGSTGVNYKIGKWGTDISYSPKEKCFRVGDGGVTERIENIGQFELPRDWVKVSGYKYNTDFFISLVDEKKENAKKATKKAIRDAELRALIKDFFTQMEKGKYYDIIESNVLADNFKIIEGEKIIQLVDRNEIKDRLRFLFECFANNYFSFDIYINVYFSEDYELIRKTYGECVFVEFKFANNSSYFSLIVKEHNGKYRIAGYRNDLDTE
jgi:hypothetical protein